MGITVLLADSVFGVRQIERDTPGEGIVNKYRCSDVEIDGAYQFERWMFGSNPEQVRSFGGMAARWASPLLSLVPPVRTQQNECFVARFSSAKTLGKSKSGIPSQSSDPVDPERRRGTPNS